MNRNPKRIGGSVCHSEMGMLDPSWIVSGAISNFDLGTRRGMVDRSLGICNLMMSLY